MPRTRSISNHHSDQPQNRQHSLGFEIDSRFLTSSNSPAIEFQILFRVAIVENQRSQLGNPILPSVKRHVEFKLVVRSLLFKKIPTTDLPFPPRLRPYCIRSRMRSAWPIRCVHAAEKLGRQMIIRILARFCVRNLRRSPHERVKKRDVNQSDGDAAGG